MGLSHQDRQRQSCSTISPSCMCPYFSLGSSPLPKLTSKLEMLEMEPSQVSLLGLEPVLKLIRYSMEEVVMLYIRPLTLYTLLMVSMLLMLYRPAMVSILMQELGQLTMERSVTLYK